MKKFIIFSASVAFAMMLGEAVLADNPDLSFWTRNISEGSGAQAVGLTDNANELIVDGNTIHVLWLTDSAFIFHFINYRRSIDNGLTWEPVMQLAKVPWNEMDRGFTSKRMAVFNNTVHIVYAEYYPHQVMYLRSTDGGASFEDARIIAPENYVANLYVSNDQEKLSVFIFAHWIEGTFLVLNSDNNGETFTFGEIGYTPTANQWTSCDMVRDGNYIYALARKSEYYNGLTRGELYFYVSSDGNIFTFTKLSFPSANGNDKVFGLQDFNYNHKIAVSGSHVYVIWSGLDEDDQHNVFLRHSADHGYTWGDVVQITKNQLPEGEVPQAGQESVIAHGSCVYTMVLTTNAHIYVKSSQDGGQSFTDLTPITAQNGTYWIDTGWWPQAVIDPTDPSGQTAHFIWGYPSIVTTRNGGASFTKPLAIGTHYSWKYGTEHPRIAVGEDGIIHTITEGLYYWDYYRDKDIFYRRLTPVPDPDGETVLRLSHVSQGERYDNMVVPSSPSLELTDQVTIEAWINTVPGSERNTSVVTKEDKGGANFNPQGYQIATHDYASQRCLNAGIRTSNGQFVCWGPSFSEGQWTHIAMTYKNDGSDNNLALYINGQHAAAITATGNLIPADGMLIIGSTRNAFGFNGLIDEVRIWNYARSEYQIQQTMYAELSGNEPGLAAYYNFNNTTKDMSGNGNDGCFMYKEEFVEAPFIAPDSDNDGISDLEERGFDGMDPSFDGNNDGIPDWKQSKAASFKSYRKNRYLTMATISASKNDIALLNITPMDVPQGYPAGFVFPYDLVEFSMDLPAGTTGAEVNFYTHSSDTYDKYMNYGSHTMINNPVWYEFSLEGSTGATLTPNVTNLKYVDGQRGDHDLAANGTITTMGGPAKSPEGVIDEKPVHQIMMVKQGISKNVEITIIAPKPGIAMVELFASDGRKIALVFHEYIQKGENTLYYSIPMLPKGIYLFRLSLSELQQTAKYLVL